jgi:hypothetical protein
VEAYAGAGLLKQRRLKAKQKCTFQMEEQAGSRRSSYKEDPKSSSFYWGLWICPGKLDIHY